MPPKQAWGLDLTSIAGADGQRHQILGIVDHGSRRMLRLQAVPSKCAWILLGHVCLAIAACGRPCSIRTDNEAMFTGRLWRRAM